MTAANSATAATAPLVLHCYENRYVLARLVASTDAAGAKSGARALAFARDARPHPLVAPPCDPGKPIPTAAAEVLETFDSAASSPPPCWSRPVHTLLGVLPVPACPPPSASAAKSPPVATAPLYYHYLAVVAACSPLAAPICLDSPHDVFRCSSIAYLPLFKAPTTANTAAIDGKQSSDPVLDCSGAFFDAFIEAGANRTAVLGGVMSCPMLAYVCAHIRPENLYFSPTLDLSRPFQHVLAPADKDGNGDTGAVAGLRFSWSSYMISMIDAPQEICASFAHPAIYGFVAIAAGVATTGAAPVKFDYVLVSRKSTARPGTRYLVRGLAHGVAPSAAWAPSISETLEPFKSVNSSIAASAATTVASDFGAVANFVETEQLVILKSPGSPAEGSRRVFSLMQIRGSIPLHWGHILTGRYTPMFEIASRKSTNLAARAHFAALETRYGAPITVANLVDSKGHEGLLARHFQSAVDLLNSPATRTKQQVLSVDRINDKIAYIHFDYHREVKKNKGSSSVGSTGASGSSSSANASATASGNSAKMALDLLLKRVEEGGRHEANSYFEISLGSPAPDKKQLGVLRTNCIDCLDRTNVVQAHYARRVLLRQLSVSEGELTEFDFVFRNIWADNADAMSLLYAGTPALKTEQTRRGVRTWRGVLDDLRNSLSRYVLNNFLDGPRQDALSIFAGPPLGSLGLSFSSRNKPSANNVAINSRLAPFLRLVPKAKLPTKDEKAKSNAAAKTSANVSPVFQASEKRGWNILIASTAAYATMSVLLLLQSSGLHASQLLRALITLALLYVVSLLYVIEKHGSDLVTWYKVEHAW